MNALRQALLIAAKEWRLLRRNPQALASLFLMPAAFLLVMSFALKNSLTADSIALPHTAWVIEDASTLAMTWSGDWIEHKGGLRLGTRAQLQQALRAGRVEAGVIVREAWAGAAGQVRADRIELWLSNRIHPASAARLRAEVNASMLQLQIKGRIAAAGPFASALLDGATPAEGLAAPGAMSIRYLYEIESGRNMTAVQQSVPAWLIFGMFFVVIPLAGVLIQERNDGTLARMVTFGVSPSSIVGGKLVAFMALNWVQLLLMLLVGRWLVPALGGDALYLDLNAGWFLLMVLATSASAVGMALLIAARTSSFDHAAALGGGANVVLAALAGIMVPRPLMPAPMQNVSEWSPMGWALDGMQAVFLGAPDAALVLPKVLLLLAFAGACLLLSLQPLRQLDR